MIRGGLLQDEDTILSNEVSASVTVAALRDNGKRGDADVERPVSVVLDLVLQVRVVVVVLRDDPDCILSRH